MSHRLLHEESYYVLSNLGEDEFFMVFTPEAGGYAMYTNNIANAKKFKTSLEAMEVRDSVQYIRTQYVTGINCMYMVVD